MVQFVFADDISGSVPNLPGSYTRPSLSGDALCEIELDKNNFNGVFNFLYDGDDVSSAPIDGVKFAVNPTKLFLNVNSMVGKHYPWISFEQGPGYQFDLSNFTVEDGNMTGIDSELINNTIPYDLVRYMALKLTGNANNSHLFSNTGELISGIQQSSMSFKSTFSNAFHNDGIRALNKTWKNQNVMSFIGETFSAGAAGFFFSDISYYEGHGLMVEGDLRARFVENGSNTYINIGGDTGLSIGYGDFTVPVFLGGIPYAAFAPAIRVNDISDVEASNIATRHFMTACNREPGLLDMSNIVGYAIQDMSYDQYFINELFGCVNQGLISGSEDKPFKYVTHTNTSNIAREAYLQAFVTDPSRILTAIERRKALFSQQSDYSKVWMSVPFYNNDTLSMKLKFSNSNNLIGDRSYILKFLLSGDGEEEEEEEEEDDGSGSGSE
tara:strand:+ start:179 stop:1495 length:1317 start_codon:yes stop_codon:yes gene_type:complete